MTTTSSIAIAIDSTQPTPTMKTFYQFASDILLLLIGATGYALLSLYL
jgi:hypothetical protein